MSGDKFFENFHYVRKLRKVIRILPFVTNPVAKLVLIKMVDSATIISWPFTIEIIIKKSLGEKILNAYFHFAVVTVRQNCAYRESANFVFRLSGITIVKEQYRPVESDGFAS